MPKYTGVKVEVVLALPEISLFDDLKGDMSRPALAGLLLRFGLAHADDAFAQHARGVLEKHKPKQKRRR
jgi:hypothetical protein